MDNFKEKMEKWNLEFEFSVPIWSDPFRYLLVINAAGTIAIVAALAQLWSSSSEIKPQLLFGLREFLYGMSFGIVIVSFSLFMIPLKRIIVYITIGTMETDLSTIVLKFFNIAWILFYFGFIIVGYGHFFCNSFDLVEVISSGLSPELREEFLNPAKGCEIPRGIVHFTSDFLASLAPWEPR